VFDRLARDLLTVERNHESLTHVTRTDGGSGFAGPLWRIYHIDLNISTTPASRCVRHWTTYILPLRITKGVVWYPLDQLIQPVHVSTEFPVWSGSNHKFSFKCLLFEQETSLLIPWYYIVSVCLSACLSVRLSVWQ